MRSTVTTLLGFLALSLVLVAGPGAAAPASAATSADCKRGHVCLFDGKRYTGALKTVGCTAGEKQLGANWDNRVSSVINRCGKNVWLADKPQSRARTGYVTVPFTGRSGKGYVAVQAEQGTLVHPGQWVRDLGRGRYLNNRADVVQVR